VGYEYSFNYSFEFEEWLQSEIVKVTREDICYVLSSAIRRVMTPYPGDPWRYELTGIRYVLSINDGIADYIYDLKEMRYCRLPLYKSACVLIKYGDLLINDGGWRLARKLAVIEELNRMRSAIINELSRLRKSRSKMAPELIRINENELALVEKALAYLMY
jgi:hypothetical protein